MKSNYKQLGGFIQPVDRRNNDLDISLLLGVSVKKVFIPSIANTVGTNMKTYKIVKKGQFTYIPDTSRRGEKIGIAMLENEDKAIISQAYTPFEVINKNELLPEYLMMWFRRPEFDRYARFKSHGSAREIFNWDEMCEVELPIPEIEKQRELVMEYRAVADRIKLNEELNKKLEETAQAIYREWFVEYSVDRPEELPKGWDAKELGDAIELFDSRRIPVSGDIRKNMKKIYPYYGAASLMDYVDDYIFDGDYILLGEDGTVITKNGYPVIQYVTGKFWVNNHAHILKGRNGFTEDSIFVLLKNTNITDVVTGGVQAKINQANLKSIKIVFPNKEILDSFNQKIKPLFLMIKNKEKEIQKLTKLKNLLLAKMAV